MRHHQHKSRKDAITVAELLARLAHTSDDVVSHRKTRNADHPYYVAAFEVSA